MLNLTFFRICTAHYCTLFFEANRKWKTNPAWWILRKIFISESLVIFKVVVDKANLHSSFSLQESEDSQRFSTRCVQHILSLSYFFFQFPLKIVSTNNTLYMFKSNTSKLDKYALKGIVCKLTITIWMCQKCGKMKDDHKCCRIITNTLDMIIITK
jgi:hypothetical protein